MGNYMRLRPSRDETPRDAVIRVRQWGTDTIHLFPTPPADLWLVDNASERERQFSKPFVAHARPRALLAHDGARWWIEGEGALDCIREDGVPRNRFVLTAGTEIGVGATTFVAESARCVQLREYCQRLLGWGGDRLHAVDHALRALRMAGSCRVPLVLLGDGDLVPLAQGLHRHLHRDHTPFLVVDPRRREQRASVRAAANLPTGVAAFTAATGGTLCLRGRRLPADLDEVIRRAQDPASEVQVVVCDIDQDRASLFTLISGTMAVRIPPLHERALELPRIVEGYAADAIAALGAPENIFTDMDRRWVLANSAQSLHQIEKGALRLVALAMSKNTGQAATRLGMAPVSLQRWLDRRPLPGRSPHMPPHLVLGRTPRAPRSTVGTTR